MPTRFQPCSANSRSPASISRSRTGLSCVAVAIAPLTNTNVRIASAPPRLQAKVRDKTEHEQEVPELRRHRQPDHAAAAPGLPCTPEQIANACVGAVRAGAAITHIH